MKKYKHLCLKERELLFAYREQGLTFRNIGKKLKRNHTTLSREYSRYAKYGKPYLPCKAQAKANKIALRQRQTCGLKNHIVFLYVRRKLRKHWSPEAIAGRLPIDHPGQTIHHETIYRYVYNSKKTRAMKLWQYLTLHRKKRMKKHGRKVANRSKIKNAISIDKKAIIHTKTSSSWSLGNR
jgi:transposase, IS30 family